MIDGIEVAVFPDGCRAAVSLTYDDAVDTHLDHAMPDLEQAGLRGTFYIPTGSSACWSNRVEEWRAAAERGHELGNHTRLHPCSIEYEFIRRLGANRSLEAYSLGRMESELLSSEDELASVAGNVFHSFAYPCGEQFVGPDRVSYRPIVERLFPAARGTSERVASDPWTVDLHSSPGWSLSERDELASVRSFLDEAIDAGRWTILVFHGVGGGHSINVGRDFHRSLVAFLASKRNVAWCAPFATVARRLREVRRQPWCPR